MTHLTAPVAGVLFAVSIGCSSSTTTFAPPPYDASAIAQAAVSQFDKNKNGQLEASELEACPGLKFALGAIDKNNDRVLSSTELKQRVEFYARQGTVSLTCVVRLDGQPLSGAELTFEPEAFMGSGFKSATTTTDSTGVAGPFLIDGKPWTALSAGVYRIRVTKPGATIPARFNTESILGREVVADARSGEGSIELALTSR